MSSKMRLRALEASEELASRILDQELELNAEPTAEGVTQLVDLYCKAIEYYEFRGDPRYKSLQTRLQAFLARPDMQATLQHSNSPVKLTPRHHKRVVSYDERARHHRLVLTHELAGADSEHKASKLMTALDIQSRPSVQRLKQDFDRQEASLRRKLANRREMSRSMCEPSFISLHERSFELPEEVEAVMEHWYDEKTRRLAAVRVKYESQIHELQGQGELAQLIVAKLTQQMQEELTRVDAETTSARLAELAKVKAAT